MDDGLVEECKQRACDQRRIFDIIENHAVHLNSSYIMNVDRSFSPILHRWTENITYYKDLKYRLSTKAIKDCISHCQANKDEEIKNLSTEMNKLKRKEEELNNRLNKIGEYISNNCINRKVFLRGMVSIWALSAIFMFAHFVIFLRSQFHEILALGLSLILSALYSWLSFLYGKFLKFSAKVEGLESNDDTYRLFFLYKKYFIYGVPILLITLIVPMGLHIETISESISLFLYLFIMLLYSIIITLLSYISHGSHRCASMRDKEKEYMNEREENRKFMYELEGKIKSLEDIDCHKICDEDIRHNFHEVTEQIKGIYQNAKSAIEAEGSNIMQLFADDISKCKSTFYAFLCVKPVECREDPKIIIQETENKYESIYKNMNEAVSTYRQKKLQELMGLIETDHELTELSKLIRS